MRRFAAGLATALALGLLPAATATATVSAPALLSADHSRPSLDSSYGSGNFGNWRVDEFGLPFFRYTIDEATDPRARLPELAGATQAQHQVGNDHIKGMAYNDGFTQFWSQDRIPQWANLYQAASNHYAGGYGYLDVDGKVLSTSYLDRPKGSSETRDFGVGYARRRLAADWAVVADRSR